MQFPVRCPVSRAEMPNPGTNAIEVRKLTHPRFIQQRVGKCLGYIYRSDIYHDNIYYDNDIMMKSFVYLYKSI